MTSDERIRALEKLGYSTPQASFLCLAALHSGFFLRRQYRHFVDAAAGRADDELVAKVLDLGHAKVIAANANTHVYHLSARPFYEVLGEKDNRHRRIRPAFAIKAKLMALDYVLAHREGFFLATEREKIGYFVIERGVPEPDLPARTYHSKGRRTATTRYFVDKFPISITAGSHSSPSVVTFCYVDEGVIAPLGFETWLRQYTRLFRAVGRFRVVYVAATDRRFEAAARDFHHLFRDFAIARGSSEKLLTYFRLEQLFRSKRFQEFDTAKIELLRRLRKEFAGQDYERLFELWIQRGDRLLIDSLPRAKAALPPGMTFETYRLHWNYDLFGS